jgi:integrase
MPASCRWRHSTDKELCDSCRVDNQATFACGVVHRCLKKAWSFVDLENGIFYRLAQGQRETNKRQPPVPIPPRLLAHLRRWHTTGIARAHIVEFNGQPVKSVKTAFKRSVMLARLAGRITPHTLRHTAATWLMQAGVDRCEAASFLGMSVETLDRVYGHHHPDHLRTAARAIGYRRRQSLAQSLARTRAPRQASPQAFEKAGGGRSRARTRLSEVPPC